VCAFYPFEVASDVVIGAFDRHSGEEGVEFRRAAVDVLARHGGVAEVEVLRTRATFEDDEALYELMTRILSSPRPIK
jgi:hypothetical protein